MGDAIASVRWSDKTVMDQETTELLTRSRRLGLAGVDLEREFGEDINTEILSCLHQME